MISIPSTSSITIGPGSFCSSASSVWPAAQTPATNTTAIVPSSKAGSPTHRTKREQRERREGPGSTGRDREEADVPEACR